VICTRDQCDSPFCTLQLTALMKPNLCVLPYCCASLCHSLIVVQPSWTAVPCPTTKLGLSISKPFVGIKQSVIGVALKIPLKKQDWEFVFTKLHFRIGPMTTLVLHQAAPPHFTTKLRPWLHGVVDGLDHEGKHVQRSVLLRHNSLWSKNKGPQSKCTVRGPNQDVKGP